MLWFGMDEGTMQTSEGDPADSASENLGMLRSPRVAGDFPDVVAADTILGSSPQRLGIRDYGVCRYIASSTSKSLPESTWRSLGFVERDGDSSKEHRR